MHASTRARTFTHLTLGTHVSVYDSCTSWVSCPHKLYSLEASKTEPRSTVSNFRHNDKSGRNYQNNANVAVDPMTMVTTIAMSIPDGESVDTH